MSTDLSAVVKGCTNKHTRKILLAALKSGCRFKKIKSGIVLYGEGNGKMITVHFTTSDHRGGKNLLAEMRKANIKGIE